MAAEHTLICPCGQRNRVQLERAFGVDLIYLNFTRQNVAMLQYKMLEPSKRNAPDWLFTPDDQFDEELERIRKFALRHAWTGGRAPSAPIEAFLRYDQGSQRTA